MRSLRSLVEELLENLDLDRIPPARRGLASWREIAGEELAELCDTPVFRGGTLIVRAHNPGVAMELKYRSSEIITALNFTAGAEVFSSIRVLLRPPGEKKERQHFDR